MTTPPSTVATATAGTYRIEPDGSTIAFTTRHMFGTGKVTGSFAHVAGDITVAAELSQSKVNATALVEAFTTGTPKRDDKVKSAALLNAADHPHLTFSSTGLQQTTQGWVLRGNLVAVGGTAPLELLISQFNATRDEMTITATGKVDRYAHGVTAMKGMVGRWLDLELTVHATRV